MCKRKIFAHAKSIYEIDPKFFISNNVKTLLVDLDNTLDSYKLFHPTEKVYKLIELLHSNNIRVVIVSNNRGKRVKTYANDLKLEYIANTQKPFAKKINKFVLENNLNKDEMMHVGDQMMTDVGAANRANIRVVLTDKIVKEDQLTTHFNRIIGRILRKRLTKKGLMIDWRDCYGKY